MTIMKSFITLCLACLALSFVACDNSNPNIDQPQSVPVLRVEASTNFDLSARQNWQFYVHGYPYNFQIDGNSITANPVSHSKTFAFSVTTTDKTGSAIITFMPENYLKTRGESYIPPNLEDQSTPEKFMTCDVLRSQFSGRAEQELSVTFFHENALLIFNIAGFPDDAKVYIEQIYNQTITPLQDTASPTEYKAIVFPENYPKDLTIVVKTAEKTYRRALGFPITRLNMKYPDGIGHSGIVSFTVEPHEEGALVFKDLNYKSYAREWPITQ